MMGSCVVLIECVVCFYASIRYASGVVFNVLGIMMFEENEVLSNGFFEGYDWLTWLLVVNSAFGGISISFVFKYLDNMTRVFAQTAAMMVGLVLSVYLFDFVPTIGFICGFVVVCVAIYLYNLEEGLMEEGMERLQMTSIVLEDDEEEGLVHEVVDRPKRVRRGDEYVGVPLNDDG
eukprot:TRINITY_DN3342_c0_g1_i2.p1 TRINITY_DN3342_c0_g1~~TRINITY_DN3342_c0_g1_i2.p1  ORF type:complete len:176 (-),score=52.76 TRINITY_DN3342_c0_g1_i2:860-1387(-)